MNASAGAAAGSGYETAPASHPKEQSGAGAWYFDPRTVLVSVSRKDFRDLQFRYVLLPPMDGPVLVFPERFVARAACLAADIHNEGLKYSRAFDPYKRNALANRIRRLHLRRVSLAVGYTWPGNPPGYIEFAERH